MPAAQVAVGELQSWSERPAHVIECILPCSSVSATILSHAANAFEVFRRSLRTDADDDQEQLWMQGRASVVLETLDLLSWVGGTAVESSRPHPLLEAFGTVDKAFTLRPAESGESLTLLDWIEQVERAAGIHFHLNEWTCEAAEKIAEGLPVGRTIPATEVMKTLEQFCYDHEFIFFPVHPSSPRIVEVMKMNRGPGELPKIMIAPDALEEWRDHPAVILQTAMHVPAERQGSLVDEMRGEIGNANFQRVLYVSETLIVMWNCEPKLREQVAFLRDELRDSVAPAEPK